MKPIHYEPHPVTPERKAELIAQGFRIIDARFAPAEDAPAVIETRKTSRRRPRKGA